MARLTKEQERSIDLVPYQFQKSYRYRGGHIYRQYEMMTKKEVIARLLIPPIRDAVRAFKRGF
jgi:hypothetical protein